MESGVSTFVRMPPNGSDSWVRENCAPEAADVALRSEEILATSLLSDYCLTVNSRGSTLAATSQVAARGGTSVWEERDEPQAVSRACAACKHGENSCARHRSLDDPSWSCQDGCSDSRNPPSARTPTVSSDDDAMMLAAGPPNDRLLRLSDREKQIVELLALGRQDKEIATELAMSMGTLRTHIGRLFLKTGHRRRTGLVVACIRSLDVERQIGDRDTA